MEYFIYDGNCNFCFRTAQKLNMLCLDKKIQFISFRKLSQEKLQEIHPTLNLDIVNGDIQLITNKVRYPGFFAIRKLSHRLKGFRYFSFLLYLPLVPFIGMLVMYILKSKNKSL